MSIVTGRFISTSFLCICAMWVRIALFLRSFFNYLLNNKPSDEQPYNYHTASGEPDITESSVSQPIYHAAEAAYSHHDHGELKATRPKSKELAQNTHKIKFTSTTKNELSAAIKIHACSTIDEFKPSGIKLDSPSESESYQAIRKGDGYKVQIKHICIPLKPTDNKLNYVRDELIGHYVLGYEPDHLRMHYSKHARAGIVELCFSDLQSHITSYCKLAHILSITNICNGRAGEEHQPNTILYGSQYYRQDNSCKPLTLAARSNRIIDQITGTLDEDKIRRIVGIEAIQVDFLFFGDDDLHADNLIIFIDSAQHEHLAHIDYGNSLRFAHRTLKSFCDHWLIVKTIRAIPSGFVSNLQKFIEYLENALDTITIREGKNDGDRIFCNLVLIDDLIVRGLNRLTVEHNIKVSKMWIEMRKSFTDIQIQLAITQTEKLQAQQETEQIELLSLDTTIHGTTVASHELLDMLSLAINNRHIGPLSDDEKINLELAFDRMNLLKDLRSYSEKLGILVDDLIVRVLDRLNAKRNIVKVDQMWTEMRKSMIISVQTHIAIAQAEKLQAQQKTEQIVKQLLDRTIHGTTVSSQELLDIPSLIFELVKRDVAIHNKHFGPLRDERKIGLIASKIDLMQAIYRASKVLGIPFKESFTHFSSLRDVQLINIICATKVESLLGSMSKNMKCNDWFSEFRELSNNYDSAIELPRLYDRANDTPPVELSNAVALCVAMMDATHNATNQCPFRDALTN